MKKIIYILICFIQVFRANAQYNPPAGQDGTSAMFKDSSAFIDWAIGCDVIRGPMNICNPDSGDVSYGEPTSGTGKADNMVVSLGDGGIATLTFNIPVVNGQGYDFAVFENSFNDTFLELAFVEVSSDGMNFFRFPAVSLTPTDVQVDGFGSIDATKINNLAGKYRGLYGVPFDLEELKDSGGLNVNNITYIRIIDVIGCIQDSFATYDSQGNKVNDPWPTPFPSGGFDIDAVGVIHNTLNVPEIDAQNNNSLNIYPNPFSSEIEICLHNSKINEISINEITGNIIYIKNVNTNCINLNLSGYSYGLYIISVKTNDNIINRKIMKWDF